ncbi:hypothetical protein BRC81_04635 [Halobacteriales archaeon QS_1_68_20]|nr:MAG: hypothetical protein BRC81_04635 [Halobacteriales archaeon QS_1_68_20]
MFGDLVQSKGELLALVAILTAGGTPVAAILGLGILVPLVPIVGFVLLLPLIAIFGDRLFEDDPESAGDPLEELRQRYARGELDHDEFERRVERLIETENDHRTTTEIGSLELNKVVETE